MKIVKNHFKLSLFSLFSMLLLIFVINSFILFSNSNINDFDFENFKTNKKINEFLYAKKITGKIDSLNRIIITDEMYSKAQKDLSDLRIFGIDKGNNIKNEIPYIIYRNLDKNKIEKINYKIINESNKNGFYYFTFEILDEIELNEIQLKFENKNFDWLIDLEGSSDLNNWYNIVNKYRILSIQNSIIDYDFSNIKIKPSRYKYYKIRIKTNETPIIKDCQIYKTSKISGKFKTYKPIYTKTIEKESNNSTVIKVKLQDIVPINKISLIFNKETDFYRNIIITTIIDSFKTETGFHYQTQNIYSGQISSLDTNNIEFESYITDNLTITIFNKDNNKLNLENLKIYGIETELICKFQKDFDYFLFYGNKNIFFPDYDFKYFLKEIPKDLEELTLGNEISNNLNKDEVVSPYIIDKKWLWLIIASLIIIIIVFSIKMMKGNKE